LSIGRLAMSGSRKLRLGVIGAGAFAQACHVPGLMSHPQAEVVMICGRDRTRTQSVAARFGIPSITLDPAELCACEQPDAVTVCTPNEAHIVTFRKHTLLPHDDCLYAFQATIPHLTRSSLHRCLQRHGISRLPDVEDNKGIKAQVQDLSDRLLPHRHRRRPYSRG